MLVVGVSRTATVFAAGILVAGASAGFAFAPFSDAARAVPAAARGRVLVAINCGTGYGVALAAPIAILAGAAWRSAWLAFAGLAVLATVWAACVLPSRPGPGASTGGARRHLRSVLCQRRALALLTGAVLVGLGSSTYWTFGVVHLIDAGALSSAQSRIFLGIVGVASVLATLTADLMRRIGPQRTFVTMTVAEALALALLALAPFSLTAAIISAICSGLRTTQPWASRRSGARTCSQRDRRWNLGRHVSQRRRPTARPVRCRRVRWTVRTHRRTLGRRRSRGPGRRSRRGSRSCRNPIEFGSTTADRGPLRAGSRPRPSNADGTWARLSTL
jgi:predicted MFS family arabinose efflux permease